MKHLCCSKTIFILFFIYTSLFANLSDKSAIVYYGDKISYPMVGIHDYIIVQPSNTNVYTHGFDVYKNKMYAYVSIGEIDRDTKEYKDLNKSLIIGQNKAWKSDVLDISNPAYKKFLFHKIIKPQIKRGFKNFFFDTLDSYQLVAKTDTQKEKSKKALIDIINTFHQRYPHAKLIINRGFEIIDKVHNAVNAVLFESYYRGINAKEDSYTHVSEQNRKWLDKQLAKVQKYNLDIIAVDYLPLKEINSQKADKLLQKLHSKGFIPYITTKDLNIYGKSSKNPIKREIFTLIDTSTVNKMLQSAHEYGALPLEYMGYIQKLYDVKNPLPKIENMQQYAGIIIWLNHYYKTPRKLINWLLKAKEAGIKIVFADNFGVTDVNLLKKFDIKVQNFITVKNNKNKILYKDKIMGYEINPPLSYNGDYINISTGKALYKLADINNHSSTLAAIMPWGGFAIGGSFMTTIGEDNIWVINPFQFFVQALRLQPLPVPDTTTENGKRLFFSHIDGDGFMNRVEWNPNLFSAYIIYKDILKKYNTPISVSIVGAEVDNNGLYPKIAPQLQKIVKEIYKLPNIEPATHTFSHPFFWNKIKNGDLNKKYRLKPKGYKFSLDYEIQGMLNEINEKYLPKNKKLKAKTIFWSGNCQPSEKILDYVYRHNILNINGGDTYITNMHPWLSYIAPIGLERGQYYQIYTGAQDENVYTNDWRGPFWGFKKVIQTFKLTNSPRRLKPIDIYYHYYAGSKRASLNALKYVYDWVLKQNTMPIFTSEYIPKAMDYYTVSMAKQNKSFFITGMRDLKTLRIEKKNASVDFKHSKNIVGFKHFQTHTYLHVNQKMQVFLKEAKDNTTSTVPYLISSNGKIINALQTANSLYLKLHAHVGLKAELFMPKNCHYTFTEGFEKKQTTSKIIQIESKTNKEIIINAHCTK